MQWTVRLEVRTSAGELKATELVMFSRPAVIGTLAEVGLLLDETKTLLARLQASMLCGRVAAYAAHHRVCAACGMLQPLKDRRTRRLQTLFGTLEVEAPRFKLCRCRQPAPMVEARTVSPICALLMARCTPQLERVQAELGAPISFREVARILDSVLPASLATHESVRNRPWVPSRLVWKLAERRVSSGVIVGWLRRPGQQGQERRASRPRFAIRSPCAW